MKALQVRRSSAKFGMARIASAVARSPRRGSDRSSTARRRSGAARAGLGARAHPPRRASAVPTSRCVEGHAIDVLRRSSASRSCPATRSSATLDDGHARSSSSRCSVTPRRGLRSAVRRCRARRRRRLRAPVTGAPRTGHPERVLLLDRRRLGAASSSAHDSQLHRIARRHARRAGGARRADRRRHPRRAARVADDRRRRASRSSPCSAPARWGSPRSPDCDATCPACGSSSAPATRTRWRIATAIGADVVVHGRPSSTAAVRRDAGCHIDRRPRSRCGVARDDRLPSASSESITDCLRITRPRGRVVLVGMPADVSLDLTGLWHRETELKGAYTYGTETLPDGTPRARSTSRSTRPTLRRRAAGVRHLPARRARRRHRPRRRCRSPRRRQDRLRSARERD